MNVLLHSMASLLFATMFVPSLVADDKEHVEAVEQDVGNIETKRQPLRKDPIKWIFGDNTFELGARLRLEGFYGKNLTLLNDDNGGLDKVLIPAKHTFDIAGVYGFGCPTFGYDIIKIKASLRTKATWGAPESIAVTDDAFIKDVAVVMGKHAHFITRNIFWARELWLEATLSEMFNLNWCKRHSITAGFFPFQLGRGIALGDAYATDPDLLGYYYPNAIDQFAPGLKISGQILSNDLLTYDIYGAILHNKSNTFTNVNARILGQEFGRRFNSARGFGKINWLLAWRLKWYPIKTDCYTIFFEPYMLYDSEREQRIEFVGDASSELGTAGFAAEAQLGNVEGGFDIAWNMGHQDVKGWDRNTIVKEIRDGTYVAVNSDVTALATIAPDVAGKKALYTPANQLIIDTAPQSQSQNGKQIDNSNLKNGKDRFNNPYTNKFKGMMAVADIGYRFADSFKMSVAAGFATGDENPNKDLDELNDSNIDGDYKGFIGIQEAYSGTRVRSAFLLSGPGRIPRVLSFPAEDVIDPFPEAVNRFTNIVFVGWSSTIGTKRVSLNPNILNYWQEHSTRIFSTSANSFVTDSFARKWLGLEINLFAEFKLCDELKLFFVGAVFLPGHHFSDIKGRPLSKEQQVFIDSLDQTGVTTERVPLVGDDKAFMANLGIEYKF